MIRQFKTEQEVLRTNDQTLTLEEYVLKQLITRGLTINEAKEIISQERGKNITLVGKWDDLAINFSSVMPSILSGVFYITLVWIDENKPEIWYRPLFAIECK